MRTPRWFQNQRSREREGDRRYERTEAVRECRRAAAGEEGATYDSFSRISDQDDSAIASVLRQLSVTRDEHATWKAAYEADAPQREARKQAKRDEEMRQDIEYCREWLDYEEQESPEAFRRLRAKAQAHEGGLAAFLAKYEISEDDWRRLEQLFAPLC